jgi:phosphoglycerol transferase MdoB-like AlkP superfamily enzyme
LFLAPKHVTAGRIGAVTSQMDLPPTIMALVGGQYRSAFFGRDVLKGQPEAPAAIVIYNKKRYGIVTDRELTILRESGDRLAYERPTHDKPWTKVAPSSAQAERTDDALAILRSAEDLLVSGRYHANPHSR